MMRPLSASDSVAVDDRVNPATTILDYSVNSMGCVVVAFRPQVGVKRDGHDVPDLQSA
jgi:hypothetical protein